MLFKQQAEQYLAKIQTRRRNPVKDRTVAIYTSYLNKILPELGNLDIADIENGVAKSFVMKLNQTNLSSRTINDIFKVMKSVIADAVDQNGNQLYPRVWNNDFIDLPVVENKDMPIITAEKLIAAISSADSLGSDMASLLILLAASGVRIGEALALQQADYDRLNGILHINCTLSAGKVQSSPKTKAGIRQVDLAPEVNDYLRAKLPTDGFLFQNSTGKRARLDTLYKQIERLGITEGFHSLRRFRATHLESQQVPFSLIQYWLGHSGKTITDRYIKIGKDLQLRKEWAAKARIGFQL